MPIRIAQNLSHAVESWYQLDLLTSLGYEVIDIGPYIDPRKPHVDTRPPLPDVPFYPEMWWAVEGHKSERDPQEHIPDAVLDWLGDDGIILFHHRLERLWNQWDRIRDWMRGTGGRRVIWRSVGQSVANNERQASPFRVGGLERVAYSPKEANIPGYVGHDALIRFYGHQVDEPWTGHDPAVIQVSQHLRQREPFTNWSFWDSATRDLPRLPIGPGSEVIGGPGALPWPEIQQRLLDSRAFLFTGSQPASYTLGFVEAMHAGIPTLSIGSAWMRVEYDDTDARELFEGHELAPLWADDPATAHHILRRLLNDDAYAADVSRVTRALAREHFNRETVGAQWRAFLGAP